MLWQLALTNGPTMIQGDLTAGEAEMVLALAVGSGIPHAWKDVDPHHCPACLNAHAIAALVCRTDQRLTPDGAALLIAQTPYVELRGMLTMIDPVLVADVDLVDDATG